MSSFCGIELSSKQKGLTLIEILVAIIVLLIGVVSVLALFPSAIKTAKFSIEDTIAAGIAESVADGLTIAMRASKPEEIRKTESGIEGVKSASAKLIHDGMPDKYNRYEFALPLPVPEPPEKVRSFVHPSDNPKDSSKPNAIAKEVFRLGNSEYIKRVIDKIRDTKGDSTEPYDQYAFTFTVSRVDDDRDKAETGSKFNPSPLFQFAISIYRLPGLVKEEELLKPMKVFVILLSGKQVYAN